MYPPEKLSFLVSSHQARNRLVRYVRTLGLGTIIHSDSEGVYVIISGFFSVKQSEAVAEKANEIIEDRTEAIDDEEVRLAA